MGNAARSLEFDEQHHGQAADAEATTQQVISQSITKSKSWVAGRALNRHHKVLDDLLLSERRYVNNMQVCEKGRS